MEREEENYLNTMLNMEELVCTLCAHLLTEHLISFQNVQ